MEEMTW